MFRDLSIKHVADMLFKNIVKTNSTHPNSLIIDETYRVKWHARLPAVSYVVPGKLGHCNKFAPV